MTDLLLEFATGNGVIALALAIIALAVHRYGKAPGIAHLLWVLVLVKLVTPSLLTVPLIPLPGAEAAIAPDAILNEDAVPMTADTLALLAATNLTTEPAADEAGGLQFWLTENWKAACIVFWLTGSAIVFSLSIRRILLFNILLRRSSTLAPIATQQLAASIAGDLKLRRTPMILATAAQISPMVWWVGGRVHVIIPRNLPHEMDQHQLRLVLAHELVHVKRGDHFVRWLEWFACIVFWWNPIAWMARRNLRINEEICCDARVLESLQPSPRQYANALMHVLEFLSAPVLQPPAVASEIKSGGCLERRFKMIMTPNRVSKTPRWMQTGVLFLAASLLPLGVAYAQDMEAVGKRLREAVNQGELEPDQARAMMETLKRSAEKDFTIDRKRAYETRMNEYEKRMRDAITEMQAMVEAGHMTEAQAEERIMELKRRMDVATEREHHQADRDMTDDREHEYEMRMRDVIAEMKAMVEAGRMSEAEAQRRIMDMKQRLDVAAQRGEYEAARRDAARATEDLKRLVEAGHITEEDARRRIDEMHRHLRSQIEREHDQATDREFSRVSRDAYEQTAAELKELVKAGRLSENHAEQRLMEMKHRIAEAAADRGEHEHAREAFAQATEELKRLVEAGRISKEEANQRISDMKKRIADDRSHETRRISGRDLDEIKMRLKDAVNAGVLTPEEAEKKFDEIQRALDIQKDAATELERRGDHAAAERMRALVEADRNADAYERERVEYQRREAQRERDLAAVLDNHDARKRAEKAIEWKTVAIAIENAVKNGEMSPEAAEAFMQRLMKSDGDAAAKTPAKRRSNNITDEWKDIKAQIEAAVKNGQLTRKEAEKKYKEIQAHYQELEDKRAAKAKKDNDDQPKRRR